jgi:hypothetical protein
MGMGKGFILAWLVASAFSACLPNTQLIQIGFYSNNTAVGASPSYCVNLHANGGNCVAQDQLAVYFGKVSVDYFIKTKLSANLGSLAASFTSSLKPNTDLISKTIANTTKNFTTISGNLTAATLFSVVAFNDTLRSFYSTVNNLPNIIESIKDSAKAVIDFVSGVFNGFFGGSSSTKGLTYNATFAANLTATLKSTLDYSIGQFQNIVAGAVIGDANCMSNYTTITNGIFCYLTSTIADQKTTVSTVNGATTFNVKVKTSTVGPALATCLPQIDRFCLLNYGISISNPLIILPQVLGGTQAISRDTCVKLAGFNLCANTTTTCQNQLYVALINEVYNPSIMTFLPSQAALDNMQGLVNNATTNFGTLRTTFSSRRLQSPSSNAVRTTADENGEDVVADGKQSGASFGSAYLPVFTLGKLICMLGLTQIKY